MLKRSFFPESQLEFFKHKSQGGLDIIYNISVNKSTENYAEIGVKRVWKMDYALTFSLLISKCTDLYSKQCCFTVWFLTMVSDIVAIVTFNCIKGCVENHNTKLMRIGEKK